MVTVEAVGESGDCNGDDAVGSADITGVVLELFDGDGTDPDAASGGTFAGTSGCDANEDGTISAADITCVVLIIFNGPGSCGANDLTGVIQSDTPSHEEGIANYVGHAALHQKSL